MHGDLRSDAGVLMFDVLLGEQARIPERFKPGAFDVWGSSHQMFHVLVLLAAAAHFRGLLVAFDYEHGLRMDAGKGS